MKSPTLTQPQLLPSRPTINPRVPPQRSRAAAANEQRESILYKLRSVHLSYTNRTSDLLGSCLSPHTCGCLSVKVSFRFWFGVAFSFIFQEDLFQFKVGFEIEMLVVNLVMCWVLQVMIALINLYKMADGKRKSTHQSSPSPFSLWTEPQRVFKNKTLPYIYTDNVHKKTKKNPKFPF